MHMNRYILRMIYQGQHSSTIQVRRHSAQKLDLLQDLQRHIRPSTSWYSCTHKSYFGPKINQLSTINFHTEFVAAKNHLYPTLPCGWQLWDQISQLWTCQSCYQSSPQCQLQNNQKLSRSTLLLRHNKMRLPPTTIISVNIKLYCSHSPLFPS